MQTRGIAVLLGGITVVFILILWFSRFAQMSAPSFVAQAIGFAEFTPVASPTIPWYADLPPEKHQFIVEEEQAIIAARETVAALETAGIKPTPLPTLVVVPITPQSLEDNGVVAGIGVLINTIDTITPPVRQFVTKNFWVAQINADQIQVYAGAFRETPDQGAIVVRWLADDTAAALPTSSIYNLPSVSGTARIIGAEGSLLYIQTTDGTTLRFDPLVGMFLSDSTLPYPQP